MNAPEETSISEHMRQKALQWSVRAEQLLALLDCAPFEKDEPPTNMAVVLAYLAVEYDLKGYLMLHKQKMPANHDLGDLLNRCLAAQNDSGFESIRSMVENLARYRVELDYPGTIQDVIGVDEARDAIRKARLVHHFILGKMRGN